MEGLEEEIFSSILLGLSTGGRGENQSRLMEKKAFWGQGEKEGGVRRIKGRPSRLRMIRIAADLHICHFTIQNHP